MTARKTRKKPAAKKPAVKAATPGVSDLDIQQIKNAKLQAENEALQRQLAQNEDTPVAGDAPVDEQPENTAGQEVNRTPRALEGHSALSLEETFIPQALLPDPPHHPDWVYRYVRVSSHDKADTRNASIRFREGWSPVPAEEMEDVLEVTSDFDDRFAAEGNIVIGGLMLCRMPRQKAEAMQAHFAGVAQQQIDGVDNNLMREVDSRVPLLQPERSTRVQFGSRD